MKVCSSYCDFNESLVHGASEDTGLPRCVMETYSPAVLLVLILVISLVKCIQRKRKRQNVYQNFDSSEDSESGPIPNIEILHDIRHRMSINRTNSVENSYVYISDPVKFVHGSDQMSFFFTFQQFLHVCLMIVPVVDVATKAGIDSSRLQGVTVFYDAASLLLWLISLLVLRCESIAFFKAKRSSHSLGMILFWAVAFINENLSFISWNNQHWWFHYKTTIKTIELGLFITRYICILLLFLLGLKAPGLYKPEPGPEVHERRGPSEAASVVSDRSGQSAFKDFWKKCKTLWPFLWPSDRWLQLKVVVCFILLALGRVVNVLIPYVYKLIVNKLTGQGHHKIVNPYTLIGIYVLLKWLGTGNSGILSNLRSFVWIKIQQFTSRTLQVRLFEHLHSLSLRWHITRKTGEVITMVNRGSNSIYNLLNYILFNILPTIADIIIAIVYFIVAFNGWFGLIVFVSMAAYLAATIIVTEWRTKFRRIMNIKDNDAKAKAVDSLLNFETVKYYAGEEFEVNRLNDSIVDYQDGEWKVLGSLAILNTAQSTIINLGLLTGAMYCGHLVVTGTLGVGEFVQFITYMVQLYVPLNFFGTYYRLIQQSFVDMENMFDLFSQSREVVDSPDATALNVSSGLIEFKDVSFGYDPSKHVLKRVSFKVYPGQTVALVGNSGGGKSTVIRLLYRFYDVLEGSISIDGQDICEVTQKSLRRTIGVVPQDTVLFNNNIRYNIRYGRLDSTDEEVEEAAMASDIHTRILTFPQRYDTLVGERGLKLSGGEKQRVAIARTILKNPPIVLLDEATSALDTKTERNIQASLDNMCINRTTIVVAHRLSTIVNADQILVLNEGEIIERGRHEELLALGGYYANMWQQQSRKSEKKKKDADDDNGIEEENDDDDDDDDDDELDSDEEKKDTGKEKTS